MLNKMVKLKNKKAFTLIEMMAVVAIVAILVAILVPVIGNSTVKSRAATNAANLRAVEAELATLKVSNPECFVAATDQSPGKELVWLAELIYGDGAGKYYLSKIDAVDGTLTFYENNLLGSGTSISQSGVPTSVAVKADTGMDVAEGMQMVVFLSGNEIIAAYAGTDGVYFDKDCFAEVAETGKFTGTGGTTSGGIVDWAGKNLCKLGIHDWGKSNNDGTHSCKRNCGAKENCDFKNGICEVCGYNNGSHKCVDEKSGALDVLGWVGPDGKCDDCGAHVHHWNDGACEFDQGCVCSVCKGNGQKGGCSECGKVAVHTCYDENNDHKCDEEGCGKTISDHTWVCEETKSLDKLYHKHKCSVCGEEESTLLQYSNPCNDCGGERTYSRYYYYWNKPSN